MPQLNSSASVWKCLVLHIVRRSHQWSLYLRILGEKSTARNYCTASLLSAVGKVFEKPTFVFRSSWSTSFLLIVLSDRIAGAFNRSGATRDVCSFWHIQSFWQDLTCWSSSKTSFLWNCRYVFSQIGSSRWFLVKKNFMAPIYGWSWTTSRLQLLPGGNWLFTTKSPEISGTHLIDLGRMKDWVNQGPPSGFEHGTQIGNPAPSGWGC